MHEGLMVAMTAAEKQRRFRARRKAERAALLKEREELLRLVWRIEGVTDGDECGEEPGGSGAAPGASEGGVGGVAADGEGGGDGGAAGSVSFGCEGGGSACVSRAGLGGSGGSGGASVGRARELLDVAEPDFGVDGRAAAMFALGRAHARYAKKAGGGE